MEVGNTLHISSSGHSNGSTATVNGAVCNGARSKASATHRRQREGVGSWGSVGLNVGDYVRLLVCSGCGFVFGIAAEKARGLQV